MEHVKLKSQVIPLSYFASYMQYILAGLAGLQGPFYTGTNCIHRRKVIYGRYPDHTQLENQGPQYLNSNDFIKRNHIFH